MKTVIYIKDNGNEIALNDHPANTKHAELLGWKIKKKSTTRKKVVK